MWRCLCGSMGSVPSLEIWHCGRWGRGRGCGFDSVAAPGAFTCCSCGQKKKEKHQSYQELSLVGPCLVLRVKSGCWGIFLPVPAPSPALSFTLVACPLEGVCFHTPAHPWQWTTIACHLVPASFVAGSLCCPIPASVLVVTCVPRSQKQDIFSSPVPPSAFGELSDFHSGWLLASSPREEVVFFFFLPFP